MFFFRGKEYRYIYGYTQTDLGNLVGVSKNTISAWENGLYQPRVCHIFKLCRIFACDPKDLFGMR